MPNKLQIDPWSPVSLRDEKFWPINLFTRALTLFVANKLGVFRLLAAGPKEPAAIAKKLKTDPKGMRILLDALVALQYVKKNNKMYENEKDTERYLTEESDQYLGTRFLHAYAGLSQWLRMEDLVRCGQKYKHKLPEFQKSAAEQRKSARDFTIGMNESSKATAALVSDMLELGDAVDMLDLGGGAGTYSIAFAKKWPSLRPVVFDLPIPARVAREVIREAGVSDRVSVKAGDFLTDDLGEKAYDVVFLSNIIHNLSIDENRVVLKKIWRALRRDGRVFIKDMMPNDGRDGPYYPLIFALTMLMFTEAGDTYSTSQVKEWLKEGGFTRIGQRIIIRGESTLLCGFKK
jgi:predicted O-methyltransferase YrrM